MGESSAIAWTQATWNPWMGCQKVSDGCDLCYMFREMSRYGKWDPNFVRRAKTTFNAPVKWKDARMIFTCSWSDWFIKAADQWREEAWQIVRDTPRHTYQILTKRHGRIIKCLPDDWPLNNVWLGVTTEDNDWFWRRASVLAEVPNVPVRFISAEPLLGEIRVTGDELTRLGINWVIAGGESGPECRPMELDWARGLRDACAEAEIPFFLKQLGGHPDKRADNNALLDGEIHMEFPKTNTSQLDLL